MTALFEKLLGTGKPLASMTFWGLVLMTGLPNAVLETFGVDLSQYLDAAGPILAFLGIRRRLT